MSDSEKNTVAVKIFNQELKIRTTEPPDYVREVARYVDAKIYEIVDSSGGISTSKTIILAALNIADELFKEREKLDEIMRELQQHSEVIAERLSEIET
ncbi:cell division protein ZapA [bacterium]|nr:MAG: cell division protein ZapA [bacterium]